MISLHCQEINISTHTLCIHLVYFVYSATLLARPAPPAGASAASACFAFSRTNQLTYLRFMCIIKKTVSQHANYDYYQCIHYAYYYVYSAPGFICVFIISVCLIVYGYYQCVYNCYDYINYIISVYLLLLILILTLMHYYQLYYVSYSCLYYCYYYIYSAPGVISVSRLGGC